MSQAERVVRRSLVELAGPGLAECLPCYLRSVISAYGCDGGLTWTQRWQGAQRFRRVRTGGLTRHVKSRGGFCDCEVLMNVYPHRLPDDDEPAAPGSCTHAGRGW